MNVWNNVLITVIAVICFYFSPVLKLSAQTTSDMRMNITIEGKTLPVSLVSNEATLALMEALKSGSITYEANDYGGFEKVGALGRMLPTSNQHITTQAGDVVLYNGNQIVLFYGSNSWSYTLLGRIEFQSLDELKLFLKAGEGCINVTLSQITASGIKKILRTSDVSDDYVSMNGVRTKTPGKGIYIKNGKKIIR